MGFDEGRIILGKSEFTYYAGETVVGRVEFQEEKTKTIKGIYFSIKGSAHTHWQIKHTRLVNRKSQTYHVDHDGNEEYFYYKQYMVGSDSGQYQLNPGRYSYPFQFQIPPNCPSSFEGEYGHIRYRVKVGIDQAFKFDQEKEVVIRVFASLDLNQNPYCREPIEMEFEDSYCCWCVSAGHVTTQIKVPASGFCPSQIVPVEVNCQNKGNVKISEIKLSIIRTVEFHAHSEPGTKHSDQTVVEVVKGSVAGDSTKSWTVDMKLPSDMPYNITNCRIIDMKYYFKVQVVPSGCHSDSEEKRDIVIGSIPLQNFMNLPAVTTQTNLPLESNPPFNPYPEYPPAVNPITPGVNVPYSGNLHNPVVGQPLAGNTPYPIQSQFPGTAPNQASLYPGPNQSYPAGGNAPYPSNPPPYQFQNLPNIGFAAQDVKQNNPWNG